MRISSALPFSLFVLLALPHLAKADSDGSLVSSTPISAPRATIVGTYRVKNAKMPVVLIELRVTGFTGLIDFGKFRQIVPNLGPSSEQVAYLEHELNENGTTGKALSYLPLAVEGKTRVAFFLHYPQFDRPLQTPFGAVALPRPIVRPKRLDFLEYDEPD